MKKIALFGIISAVALLSGCATKSVVAEGKGMYANTKSGVVGIGSFDIEAIPETTESAFIRYYEDTAWLSPSTKTHSVKVFLTGTNSIDKVDRIVDSICTAFSSSAKYMQSSSGGKTFFDSATEVQKAKLESAKSVVEEVVLPKEDCPNGECSL